MSQPPYPPPGPWPPPYGHPPAGWPPAPPPPRRRTRATVVWVVAGSVLAAAVLVAVVIGGRQLGRSQADLVAPGAVTTGRPAAPTELGDDPVLDGYAQRCHDGTLSACDELFGLAPSGSAYEQYGMTCGGRVKAYDVSSCTDLAGAPPTSPPADPTGLGDDPGLDGYAQRCHDGLLAACDDLYQLSPPMSGYERYGMTCGGRVEPLAVARCTDLEDD
ncbi:hypothetical protein [Geodermatophilus sp. SYSU D00815]